MNPANLSKTPIDPTGKYVLTTRCRTGRSVRVPDSHHAAHSKKDVNSNVLSSRVLWVLKVTLRVTISHSTATAHTLPSQPVCPWKRKKNSAPTVTSSKNQTPPFSSHLVAVATGQTLVVSSTTKPKTSSSGSMKKIK